MRKDHYNYNFLIFELSDFFHEKHLNIIDFREYILGLLFYKYLSEKIQRQIIVELKLNKDNFREIYKREKLCEELRESILYDLGYFIELKYLFSNIAKKAEQKEYILDDLIEAFNQIELSAADDESLLIFRGIFDDIYVQSRKIGSTEKDRNIFFIELVKHIDNIDFSLDEADVRGVGDLYEFIIEQFALGTGKLSKEIYTPIQVTKLLAKIVTIGKDKIKSVYDPTCGTGTLLLRVTEMVEEVDKIYGQEMIFTNYNLAKMNMLLHDKSFDFFEIKFGDSLENPQHLNMKFDVVVSSHPFYSKWSADKKFIKDERFKEYNKLVPKTKPYFAYVQHMIYHLNNKGTMAIVLPVGILYRESTEGVIRKSLIKDKNYLDAVIVLPKNVFYVAEASTCILVFKKCRKNISDVLFIDVSEELTRINKYNVLEDENINKILDTYINRKSIEKYSYVAKLEEIEENGYNLNVEKYI